MCDMVCALGIEHVAGGEVEPVIEPSQRYLEAGMDEIAGFNHGHAGSAAIRVTVGQPKQCHPLSIAMGTAAREGGIAPLGLRSSKVTFVTGRRESGGRSRRTWGRCGTSRHCSAPAIRTCSGGLFW
jgi:hypothetical protein